MDRKKEQRAIQYLKTFEPESEPYYLCYSGGKDSDCIRILAELADVKHDIVHNHTTVDAPETVRYIRSIPKIKISYPELTMWKLIVKKKMPPSRFARYCCEELKERGGKGRMKITGVRWAESQSRKENGGIVKIIGKPKTVQRLALENEINFRLTGQGGGAKRRQLRNKKICRTLLQNNFHNVKPDCRLDGRRRMGVLALLRLPIKPTLSVWRKADRLYRMPAARRPRNERRFCKIPKIQSYLCQNI